jgi:hypothetical protein
VCRAGLDRVKNSRWVEPEHEATLRQLVDAVMKSKPEV